MPTEAREQRFERGREPTVASRRRQERCRLRSAQRPHTHQLRAGAPVKDRLSREHEGRAKTSLMRARTVLRTAAASASAAAATSVRAVWHSLPLLCAGRLSRTVFAVAADFAGTPQRGGGALGGSLDSLAFRIYSGEGSHLPRLHAAGTYVDARGPRSCSQVVAEASATGISNSTLAAITAAKKLGGPVRLLAAGSGATLFGVAARAAVLAGVGADRWQRQQRRSGKGRCVRGGCDQGAGGGGRLSRCWHRGEHDQAVAGHAC